MNKEKRSDFNIQDLRRISDSNISDAKKFLKHSFNWEGSDVLNSEVGSNLKIETLRDIVINPNIDLALENPIDFSEFFNSPEEKETSMFQNSKEKIKDLIRQLEQERQKVIENNLFLSKKTEESEEIRHNNSHIVDSISDGVFEWKIRDADITCALIISDTIWTRETQIYKSVVDSLKKCSISYVEYTNVQPNLDRRLVFKIAEFAHDHEVNTIIVVGSMSSVDLAKIVIPKISRPNLFSLHLHKKLSNSVLPTKYYLFTIPTFVVPEKGINARSAIKNNILFPKFDLFGDAVFLNGTEDDSDAVFYSPEVFDLLDKEKTIEVLHETFFRLIFNYFDLSTSNDFSDCVVENVREIEKYLGLVESGIDLSIAEKYSLLKIISSTLNKKSFVDVEDFWVWYRLEGRLSLLVNSKKSQGLALFLPSYLKVLSEHSIEFSKRAAELGNKLYGTQSVEGFILRMLVYIKQHKLPISFLDIPEIKKVDYMFLVNLIRKTSNFSIARKLAKTITKDLTIW